jgi:DNA mismatch repair protein MutL
VKIKILSHKTISKIAAGEVIHAPSSVVKELVENSIDATSSKIDIVIEASGKNLILVSDNGVGMCYEDLMIAFKHHTSSKINEDDLQNINYFGFRGEALASISHVSKMNITSKSINSTKAYSAQIIEGELKYIKPALHKIGTKIEVRDLFFSTNARLKFLKSDKTEFWSIVDIVRKIALSHPHISFNLFHNGKEILKLKSDLLNMETSYNKRIIDILGEEWFKNSIKLDMVGDRISIFGYATIPTFNKATSDTQFLFVNNRSVKNKIMQTALKVAYHDYIDKNRYPYCVLFLTIDNYLIDVNIHPAKSEIYFHNQNMVRDLIITSIKDALKNYGKKTSTNISKNLLLAFSVPKLPDKLSDINQNYKSYLDNNARLGVAKTQIFDKYIISQTNDTIILIDQHAAHERLKYENIKKSYEDICYNSVELSSHLIITFDYDKYIDILSEYKDELSNLGFFIKELTNKSIKITHVPDILQHVNLENLIHDMVEYLINSCENIPCLDALKNVIGNYACHNAIKSGTELSMEEMNEILRNMEKTDFSEQCNHGRPTYIELKLKDIDKLFGR